MRTLGLIPPNPDPLVVRTPRQSSARIVSAVAACGLVAVTAAACAPEAPTERRPGPEDVASHLLPAVVLEGEPATHFTLEERMARYNVPGVSVAVMLGGEIGWAHGWGVADTETGAPVTPNTLFQAASMSKPVAALAALSLVEEGALDLDAPVNDYLTSWRVPDNDFTADSAVTLRGILTHSAGLTVWGFPGYSKGEPFSDERPIPTAVQVLEGEGNTPPVRVFKVPGTGWQYSGGGYTVMQQMLEDVTAMPFAALLRARVLDPAGMTRSTYEQPLPEQRWPEAARGHRGDGSEVEGEWHSYPEQAAAGLWTTPTELLTLSLHLQGILDGRVTDGVLSPPMLEAMLTPNHEGDEAFRGVGLGFGLTERGGEPTYGHGGANEGFRDQWVVYRNGGRGAVVMTNGDRGGALTAEILRGIAAVYDWPGFQPEVRAARALTPEEAEGYAGEYVVEGQPDFVVTVRVGDGVLLLEVPEQGASTLHADAETDDTFFDLEDGDSITFERDADGAVVAATAGGTTRLVRH